MAFYDADDAAIYYEQTGDGKPVLLMHGYALNSLMWKYQQQAISENFRMITVDLRGFGQSSCGGKWSGNIMADDISGLINELDIEEATIVGFSMSGPAAFRLALKHPDRIAKLVMVSSILPSAGRPRETKEAKSHKKELDILTLRGVDAWADAMGIRKGPLVGNIFKRNPDSRETWEKMLSRHNPDFLRCMMEARQASNPSENWRARLAEVTQPTLIIAGAQDERFIDASSYMERQIPNARLEIISGAGHMVNLEKPDEFNAALLSFLNE